MGIRRFSLGNSRPVGRKEIIYVSNVPEAGIWVHKAAQKCRKFRRQNFPIVASSVVSYHNGLNFFSEIVAFFYVCLIWGLGCMPIKLDKSVVSSGGKISPLLLFHCLLQTTQSISEVASYVKII